MELTKTTPAQFEDNPIHKLRNVLLEILNRLPNTETLRPFVKELMKLIMILLAEENEDNALICLRILIDLHKNYRPSLDPEVQGFINFVLAIYEELPKTVEKTFSEVHARNPHAQAGGPPLSPLPQEQPRRSSKLIKSIHSFKVLTECPIIVVLLFQLYPRHLQPNVRNFMPLIIKTLAIEAPEGASTQHRALYTDFIAAQGLLSFLGGIFSQFFFFL